MGENTGGSAGGTASTPPHLTVGGLVAGGRYELLESHGGVAGQAFWKARDRRLSRTVALTFVDPLPGEEPPGSVTGVLDRTVALTAVYSDGLARVLDVIRGRAGGIVVTEWVPGRSLAAAATEPTPDAAVGAVWGLSDAATRTEEAGLVLGLDSPDRVRLTEDGRALLAFPGVTADVDSRGDVRGLGAVLYALLTGRWPLPLPEGSASHQPVDGRPEAAPRDDDDELLDPAEIASGVSPESAVLALRSLDGSAVSSAATVRAMVADRVGGPVRSSTPAFPATSGSPAGSPSVGATAATVSSSSGSSSHPPVPPAPHSTAPTSTVSTSTVPTSTVPTSPTSSSGAPTAAAQRSPGAATSAQGPPSADPTHTPDGSSDDGHDTRWPASSGDPDPERQKRRWQIMAGTGAAAVVVIALLSVWMLGALGGNQSDTPLSQQLDAIERAAQASRASETAAPEPAENEDSGQDAPEEDADGEQTTPAPLSVSTATSWQPASSNGTAENSSNAPNVIDGSPSTSWSTDTYRDQFGTGPSAYKAGIGLMLTLDRAQELREVELLSEDDIRFEIRSSDTANPTSLDDTTRLGSGRTSNGTATVEIDDPAEAEYVLVWITRLGTSGPQAHQATVTEVELLG